MILRIVWFGFASVCFGGILLVVFSEVGRVYRLLDMVREVCPGHGPIHLLVAGASGIGFHWDPHVPGWLNPGLPGLSNLAGPIQHYNSAILDAWRDKVSTYLCAREGFGGRPPLDVASTLQLLNSSHVRER